MSFIWDGVSSDTMKFNVTSRQVYNAPAYDLNAIEVPGRSGDLLNPQNRFKNKQISYTGFLKASDFEGSTWREKLSTGLIQLKGWLCSDAGTYHELTDDYDPGFTRYGYISGETAISDVQDRPFGVTLTVTFNCKPFMYKAGEPMELPETKSASGSIITITDGAENTPLKSAVVNIEPVQDLHGYDYPWPAGGGVNMAHLSDGSRTGQGCTGTVSSEVISVSGTASATYVNVTYFNDINIVSGQSYTVRLSKALTVDITFRFATDTTDTTYQQVSVNAGYTSAVFTANNNFAKYRICVSGVTSETVINVSGLQIFVGQGTISEFSPYSNVCPISGWSEVNVVTAGGNLLPNKFYQDGANTVVLGQERSANAGQDVFLKAGTYHIDVVASKTASLFYKRSGEDTVRITTSSLSGTFTLTKDGNYVFWAYAGTGITVANITSVQISVGSTASPYAAPTITPITISLGQTVYGGTLNVPTGVCVVTYAKQMLKDLTISINGVFPNTFNLTGNTDRKVAVNLLTAKSNVYEARTSSEAGIGANGVTAAFALANTSAVIYVRDARATTGTQLQNLLNSEGSYIVYELATPIEVDLTPQTIKALKGTNNIWADAGSMEIEYPIPTENPYPFGSRPLYEITMAGTGTLVVNGKEWTITDYTGTLYCDTEAMEWYDASQLRNSIVSGDGWPVFEAGENSVSYTGDITKVMVTPRWRTL